MTQTLNDAQMNYTTTEKELIVVVFAFNKLWPYVIGNKTTIYTDHVAI